VIYASALNGIAGMEADDLADDMNPLFQTIIDKVPPPPVNADAPFQMQISALDYNSYVGVIGIGRITGGVAKPNMQVTVIDKDGETRKGKILQVKSHLGLDRVDVTEASAGEIICITGLDRLNISDTLCDPDHVEAMTPLTVDQPTITMTFQVNDSPFAGREGKFVTTRNIRERLDRELIHNVALRVEQGETPDKYKVSGRGELHLSVLIETMRREGFELAVSRPQVIMKEIDGVVSEPFEVLMIDCNDEHQGSIIEELGLRRAEMTDMLPDGKGRVRLTFTVPTRGLIGFRSMFLSMTSGTGMMNHVFDHYGPAKPGDLAARKNGVLVSMVTGKALGYSLWALQERGRLFIEPNVEVYEGMIIGLHSRDNDLVVNPIKGKQLTNVRASGTDENITLTPPVRHTLEQAMEFIDEDELVEITPASVRIRKKHLTESDRKRASRGGLARG
jgi:GTP-binding protein